MITVPGMVVLAVACSSVSHPPTDGDTLPDQDVLDAGPDHAPDPVPDPAADHLHDSATDAPWPPKTIALVRAGQSNYIIVLDPSASPSETRAAQDLQATVLEATGAKIPIGSSAKPGQPAIVLGIGEAARGLGVDPDPATLGEQGYLIRAVPPNLVVAGTRAAGTMCGVHRSCTPGSSRAMGTPSAMAS